MNNTIDGFNMNMNDTEQIKKIIEKEYPPKLIQQPVEEIKKFLDGELEQRSNKIPSMQFSDKEKESALKKTSFGTK